MGKKILVVDDNADSRQLEGLFLSGAGYEVLQAANAEDAIHVAGKAIPDLILMDICMPGINGLEAMYAIKEDSATEDIKIVALTALADRGKMMTAGCDGYIPKPIINSRDFLDTVATFLS